MSWRCGPSHTSAAYRSQYSSQRSPVGQRVLRPSRHGQTMVRHAGRMRPSRFRLQRAPSRQQVSGTIRQRLGSCAYQNSVRLAPVDRRTRLASQHLRRAYILTPIQRPGRSTELDTEPGYATGHEPCRPNPALSANPAATDRRFGRCTAHRNDSSHAARVRSWTSARQGKTTSRLCGACRQRSKALSRPAGLEDTRKRPADRHMASPARHYECGNGKSSCRA